MSSINRVFFYFKELGVSNTLKFIRDKYHIERLSNNKKYLDSFAGKNGLEIGGPSNYFNEDNILPIYSVIKGLDGVNFSTNTIWEGSLTAGETFRYDNFKKSGHQYICDAVDLNMISSEKYDFVISCNNLEHIANPFKAMHEWLRVTKSGGLVFLVLPNKRINFDHKRSVTSFDHLVSDYNSDMREDDMTHIDEILKTHDLFLDPLAGSLEKFRERALRNYENRALHQHVFDLALLKKIYDYFNIEIITSASTFTDHYILGRKKIVGI